MTAPTIARTTRQTATATLGTDISRTASLDDALELANLDWNIIEEPAEKISLLTDEGVITTSIPGQRLIMRDDNFTTLGVVGSRYEPVSNADAFALADAAHMLGAEFSHAGELDHGRKTFLSMKLPEAQITVGGYDIIDFSINLSADHAGRGTILGDIQGTRLVCTNGMRTGFGDKFTWSIRHTKTAEQRMDEARETLHRAMIYAADFANCAEALIASKFTANEFDSFIGALFPKPDEDLGVRAVSSWEKRRDQLMHLFVNEDTQEEGRNTKWAAYNAVAEWNDWVRPAQGGAEGRALRNFRTRNNSNAVNRAFDLLVA